jgi:SAM-dependent methyltransferase
MSSPRIAVTDRAASSSSQEATYTYGHSPGVVTVHARRTAAREAAFFLPYLYPGMRLLDAGCGPGSITVGLAEAVAPGEVIGIDIAPEVLAPARALVRQRGLNNVRFQQGDVDALPFDDATFDAVFAHTLLEHVADGVRVLRELQRVLRPGGVIGVRDCDWASGVFAPDDMAVTEAMTVVIRGAVGTFGRCWGRPGSSTFARPYRSAGTAPRRRAAPSASCSHIV